MAAPSCYSLVFTFSDVSVVRCPRVTVGYSGRSVCGTSVVSDYILGVLVIWDVVLVLVLISLFLFSVFAASSCEGDFWILSALTFCESFLASSLCCFGVDVLMQHWGLILEVVPIFVCWSALVVEWWPVSVFVLCFPPSCLSFQDVVWF